MAIPTHSEVVENALPEMVDADEAERQQAVSKAVRWINQFITEELWGLIPSNQAEVDRRLRYSFHFKIITAGYKHPLVFMFQLSYNGPSEQRYQTDHSLSCFTQEV